MLKKGSHSFFSHPHPSIREPLFLPDFDVLKKIFRKCFIALFLPHTYSSLFAFSSTAKNMHAIFFYIFSLPQQEKISSVAEHFSCFLFHNLFKNIDVYTIRPKVLYINISYPNYMFTGKMGREVKIVCVCGK